MSNYKFEISKLVDVLNQDQLGELIDVLVEHYVETYGIDGFSAAEPNLPEFEFENLDLAKNILDKFRN
jgi:hypothetical protein